MSLLEINQQEFHESKMKIMSETKLFSFLSFFSFFFFFFFFFFFVLLSFRRFGDSETRHEH